MYIYSSVKNTQKLNNKKVWFVLEMYANLSNLVCCQQWCCSSHLLQFTLEEHTNMNGSLTVCNKHKSLAVSLLSSSSNYVQPYVQPFHHIYWNIKPKYMHCFVSFTEATGCAALCTELYPSPSGLCRYALECVQWVYLGFTVPLKVYRGLHRGHIIL